MLGSISDVYKRQALAMLMGIGGVTVTAIRLGRGDEKGANDAFLHASAISVAIGVLLMLAGRIFSRPVAAISGANGTFLELTATYIFYYSAFSLPFVCSSLLQGFVRNDGSPGLVSVAVITGAVDVYKRQMQACYIWFSVKRKRT